MEPRISVIMAVHNGERYVREAVDSILTQTLSDLELVIVNDGSSDAIAAILATYGDPRVRWFAVTDLARQSGRRTP